MPLDRRLTASLDGARDVGSKREEGALVVAEQDGVLLLVKPRIERVELPFAVERIVRPDRDRTKDERQAYLAYEDQNRACISGGEEEGRVVVTTTRDTYSVRRVPVEVHQMTREVLRDAVVREDLVELESVSGEMSERCQHRVRSLKTLQASCQPR